MNLTLQMIITVTADGQINVQGPLHDKIACYGLLEAAKDAIRDCQAAAAAKRVIPAKQMPKVS